MKRRELLAKSAMGIVGMGSLSTIYKDTEVQAATPMSPKMDSGAIRWAKFHEVVPVPARTFHVGSILWAEQPKYRVIWPSVSEYPSPVEVPR